MKQLNGVGEPDNAVASETWSNRVAAALFEQEQMEEISALPGFNVLNYGDSGAIGDKTSDSFKAVIEFMKVSRLQSFFLFVASNSFHLTISLSVAGPPQGQPRGLCRQAGRLV